MMRVVVVVALFGALAACATSSAQDSVAEMSKAAPALRTVSLRLAPDEGYRRFSGWEADFRRTLQKVSDAWELEFQIRFVIVDIVPWHSGTADTPAQYLEKLDAEVPPGDEILVGIFHDGGQLCAEPGRGWGQPFGRRAVIVTGCPTYIGDAPLTPEAALSHELAHLFGAFHPPKGTVSIMSGRGAYNEFDSYAARVILLMRTYDFRKGVTGLSAKTRQDWMAIWSEAMASGAPESNNLAMALTDAGAQAYRANQLSNAAPLFREALELQQTYAPAHFMLGQTLRRQGDLPGAFGEYREAFRRDYRIQTLLKLLTVMGGILNRRDEVIEDLRDAIRTNPPDISLQIALIETLLRAERYQEARAQVTRAWATGHQIPADVLAEVRAKVPEPLR